MFHECIYVKLYTPRYVMLRFFRSLKSMYFIVYERKSKHFRYSGIILQIVGKPCYVTLIKPVNAGVIFESETKNESSSIKLFRMKVLNKRGSI